MRPEAHDAGNAANETYTGSVDEASVDQQARREGRGAREANNGSSDDHSETLRMIEADIAIATDALTRRIKVRGQRGEWKGRRGVGEAEV